MKKAILIFAAAVAIASCSNGSNGSATESINDSSMIIDSAQVDLTIVDSTAVDSVVSK